MGRSLWLWVVLVGVGCGREVVDDDPKPGETGEPFTYVPEDPDPLWTADEVATQLDALFAEGLPQCTHFIDHYVAAREHGNDDGVCPGPDEQMDQILGCTSEDGWWFAGIAGYEHYINPRDEGTGQVANAILFTDFEIRNPEGEAFHAGGTCNYWGEDTATGMWVASSWFHGSGQVGWADDWYGDGVSQLNEIEVIADADVRAVILDGGFAWGENTLLFRDVKWNAPECFPGVIGSVALRGPQNHWYELEFTDCQPCGQLVFHDTHDLGEICVDLEPLMDSVIEAHRVPELEAE